MSEPLWIRYQGQLYRRADVVGVDALDAQLQPLLQEFEAEVTKLIRACQPLGTLAHRYETRVFRQPQLPRESHLHVEFHIRPLPNQAPLIVKGFAKAMRALGYDVQMEPNRSWISARFHFRREAKGGWPFEGTAGFHDNSMYVRVDRYDAALVKE